VSGVGDGRWRVRGYNSVVRVGQFIAISPTVCTSAIADLDTGYGGTTYLGFN
jgi:hypothetical protein